MPEITASPVGGRWSRGVGRGRIRGAALGLVAVGVALTVAGCQVDPTPDPATAGSAMAGSATATPSTSDSTTASKTASTVSTPTPSRTPGTRTNVVDGSSSFVLPEGWTSEASDDDLGHLGRPEATVHALCLNDSVADPRGSGCDLTVEVGRVLLGNEGQKVWEPGQDGGWYWRSDVGPCPVPGGPADDYISGGGPPAVSFAPIGSKTAERYTEHGTCGSGRTFTATQYWLPVSHIRITEVPAHPQTRQILDSFDFTGP